MLWALVQFLLVSRIPVRSEGISDSTGLVSGSNDEATTRRLTEIYTAIYEGAESFLRAEYTICGWFIIIFGAIIFVLVSWGTGWDFARGLFTALSFILGACTSIREYLSFGLGGSSVDIFDTHTYSHTCQFVFIPSHFCPQTVSGYLAMKVAVYSNVRTTVSAQKSGWTLCFNTAFR